MLPSKIFLNFYDSVFKYFTTFLPNFLNLTAIFIKQLTFTESSHIIWFTFHRKITPPTAVIVLSIYAVF